MRKWLLAGIIVLALLLRVVALGDHPAGFTPDEASQGYDAYSLLRTGRDQWGEAWPLTFRSFGDFKLPLYTYLTIPCVAVFGLNEFAVRLPNALLATGAVVITYFLTKELFKDDRIAILAMLLLAVSPWHVPLSRGAFEANLTTFFLPLGILLYLKALKRPNLMILSAFAFGLNLFSYHSARLLTILVVIFLVHNYRTKLRQHAATIIGGAIFSLFCITALFTMFSGGASRAATSGIFNPTDDWGAVANNRYAAVKSGEPDVIARIFNNKLTYFSAQFTANYLQYFSPQFLITGGPAEGTYGMVPGLGVIFAFESVFLISFFVWFLKNRSKQGLLILFWVIISPLAAALAKGPGYAANRAAFMLPALQIMSAIGGIYFLVWFQKHAPKNVFALSLTTLILVSSAFTLQAYVVKQRTDLARDMLYGVKDAIVSQNAFNTVFDEVIVSKKISEPHIYVAFYKKLDPRIVQAASLQWLNYEKQDLAWLDQLGTYRLGEFVFTSIDSYLLQRPNTLLIGIPADFPEKITPDIIIPYPNRAAAYYIVSTQDQFAQK